MLQRWVIAQAWKRITFSASHTKAHRLGGGINVYARSDSGDNAVQAVFVF